MEALNTEPQLGLQAMLMLAAGAMIATAAGMLRAPSRLQRWVGVVFDLSVAGFALKLWNDQTKLIPPEWCVPLHALTVGCVGWFWLFVIVLFDDATRIRKSYFAAVGVLTVSGLAQQYGPLNTTIFPDIVFTILQLGMAGHVLLMVWHGWKGDLVEERRRLRGPFFIAVVAYILALRGFDLWEAIGTAPDWYPMANAGALALVCLAGAFVFLDARNELFAEAAAPLPIRDALRKAAPVVRANGAANGNGHAPAMVANGNGHSHAVVNGDGLDRAEKADLERLEALMCREEVWREEGLTIASLALRAAMPETQLRRLISDRLGYRNFPSYVNAHRVACAKQRLADPREARISVSAIAYEIGFASLGPFNRAFREETGLSPTEWRRTQLNEPSDDGSPIPEKA